MTEGAVDARDARVVVEWITGRHVSFARAVMCDPGTPVAPIAAALASDDVLIAPTSTDIATAAHVIAYDGSFDEIGDVLHVAGHAVEVQHYAAAAYVEILGPTVVRFFDSGGWEAFLGDADLAREAGAFAGPLTDPRLRLADADVLREPFAARRPASLRLRADGRITAGTQGEAIAEEALAAPAPRWSALAGAIESTRLVRDLSSRPWLGRLLGAATVFGTFTGADDHVVVDGFGWSVLDPAEGDVEPHPDDPFLLRTASGLILADFGTRRQQRLPESTAVVVSAVQRSVDLVRAAERASSELGITVTNGDRLCREAVERLGIRSGVSVSCAGVPSGGGA